MYPKLKFKIDPKKDLIALYAFIAESSYDNGRILVWALFKKYPILKKYKQGTSMKIGRFEAKKFINNFYKAKLKIFQKNAKGYDANWKKIAQEYFLLVDELFKGRPWPKGKYWAYLTMWGLCPKYLSDKTFLVLYRHKNKKFSNLVIAHELLHFMFFDYFLNKYKKYKADKYDFFVWHISEIFNSLILNSKEWQKLLAVKNLDYPEHKMIINKIRKKYHNQPFILDKVILDIIKEVSVSFGK